MHGEAQGKWRLKRSGLQDMAERYRFETYEAKTSWQKSILAAAECFCEEREGWFYIGGQVGAGKTHICTAIANRLMLQGKGVRYMIWTEEATKLKALKTDDENARLMSPSVGSAPFLVFRKSSIYSTSAVFHLLISRA